MVTDRTNNIDYVDPGILNSKFDPRIIISKINSYVCAKDKRKSHLFNPFLYLAIL